MPILDECLQKQKAEPDFNLTPSKLIHILGEKVDYVIFGKTDSYGKPLCIPLGGLTHILQNVKLALFKALLVTLTKF